MSNSVRDAEAKPVVYEVLGPFFERWERMRSVLSEGWGTRGGQHELLPAAMGDALDFTTWRSLARGQGSTTAGRRGDGPCGAWRGSECHRRRLPLLML